MTQNTETQLLELVAVDRLHIPLSSLDGKLKRMKPKIADAIELPTGEFRGSRVYGRIEIDDRLKARSMSDAVDEYCENYPAQGKVLTQIIEDKRATSETYLHFGMQPGCRLTADDYLGVMSKLGFTEAQARNLYGPLMETSRSISRKREDTDRTILIG
jgi:hypothetical protein